MIAHSPTSELTVQVFAGTPVRVYGTPESPLFVAADVCRILDLSDVTSSLRSLEDDEKGPLIVRTPGGDQTMNAVTESGLYALIFKSRKSEAKAFRRWVTGEVLPQLRATGSYGLSIPKNLPEALRLAASSIERAEHAEAKVATLAPKAATFDLAISSENLLDMNAACKLVAGGHRNNFMRDLREKKILLNDNTPAQEYIDRGYFKVKESIWTNPNTGKVHVKVTTMVTQRGLDFLRRCSVKLANLRAQLAIEAQAKFPTITGMPSNRSLVAEFRKQMGEAQ